MSLLETDVFEERMAALEAKLDRNYKAIISLKQQRKYLDGEQLMDNQDLCQFLRVSKRTLQRYRSSGLLKYHPIRHKTYYKESEVEEFIKNHFKKEETDNFI